MKRRRRLTLGLSVAALVAIASAVWLLAAREPKPLADSPPAPAEQSAKWLLDTMSGERLDRIDAPSGLPAPKALPELLAAVGCERASISNLAFVRDSDRPGWEWRFEILVKHRKAEVLDADVLAAFKASGYVFEGVSDDPTIGSQLARYSRRVSGRVEEVVRVGRAAPMTGGPDNSSSCGVVWRAVATEPAPAPTYAELTRAMPQLAPGRRGPIPIPEAALVLLAEHPVRRVYRLDANASIYFTTIDVAAENLEHRLRELLLAEGFELYKPPPRTEQAECLTKRRGTSHCTVQIDSAGEFVRVHFVVQIE